MYTGHENKDRFSSRHWFTLQPVFSILPLPYPPPPPHPTPFYLVLFTLPSMAFLVASQVRKLQEGFPVHLHQMSV